MAISDGRDPFERFRKHKESGEGEPDPLGEITSPRARDRIEAEAEVAAAAAAEAVRRVAEMFDGTDHVQEVAETARIEIERAILDIVAAADGGADAEGGDPAPAAA